MKRHIFVIVGVVALMAALVVPLSGASSEGGDGMAVAGKPDCVGTPPSCLQNRECLNRGGKCYAWQAGDPAKEDDNGDKCGCKL